MWKYTKRCRDHQEKVCYLLGACLQLSDVQGLGALRRCCLQCLLCYAVGGRVSVYAHQCVQLWMFSYQGCRVPSSAQSAIHKSLYPTLFKAGHDLLENKILLLQLRIARRQP